MQLRIPGTSSIQALLNVNEYKSEFVKSSSVYEYLMMFVLRCFLSSSSFWMSDQSATMTFEPSQIWVGFILK